MVLVFGLSNVLRYVNLGSSGRPLATADPATGDILPADDDLWDRGEPTTSEPLYVSSPTLVKAGPFARTCQACNLMGRLLHFLNDPALEGATRFDEAMQIHRTLIAFAKLLPDEVNRDPARCGTAMALCYGALLHLYDPWPVGRILRGIWWSGHRCKG